MNYGIYLFVLLLASSAYAQDTIKLNNPSFEQDRPGIGKVPESWIDLGSKDMTPVDIQPGIWNVRLAAQDGQSYVGMVVRDNNTWEGIGQILDGVLEQGSTYTFSLWLAKSNTYTSATPLSNGEEVIFKAPTVLKIWGYNTESKAEELLAESQVIGIEKWTKYQFILMPQFADYNEIDLMAYYSPGHENECGNLLIDNCSAIVKMK